MEKELQERRVVTCFLESAGEILILRRSEQVGSYRDRWAGVSGYVETSPDKQALVEIKEETGLCGEEVRLMKKGKTVAIEDEQLGVKWVVYPYLFRIKERSKVRIDWEHKEIKWIKPEEIGNYQTVPQLKEMLTQVMN